MRSEYIKIEKDEEGFQSYLNYVSNGDTVAVYHNGIRLFLNEDYRIIDRMIILDIKVKADDRIIVSYS